MDQAGLAVLTSGPAAQSAARTARPSQAADRATIDARAVEFESLYLAQMLAPMFDGLKTEAPFGGGFGEDVWRSMQVQEFGEAIARSGGIGIADAVSRELLRLQELHDGASGETP